jgi:hypothetical protein
VTSKNELALIDVYLLFVRSSHGPGRRRAVPVAAAAPAACDMAAAHRGLYDAMNVLHDGRMRRTAAAEKRTRLAKKNRPFVTTDDYDSAVIM